MVSYFDRWMSVVRRVSSTIASPYMALFKKIKWLQFHCISRSHRLKIDFQDENLKKMSSEKKMSSLKSKA